MINYQSKQYLLAMFIIFNYTNQGLSNNGPSNNGSLSSSTPKPPALTISTYSAAEMCYEYSKLIYSTRLIPTHHNNITIRIRDCYFENLLIRGSHTDPKEYPHMALLGYGESIESKLWGCGGSIISKRWILTAANCAKFKGNPARWARLGEINDRISSSEHANPKDYKIIRRVIHPDYRHRSKYDDIALFGLDEDIQFSPHIRPICLSADYSLQLPTRAKATCFEQIEDGTEINDETHQVTLDIIPIDQCKTSFENDCGLSHGIDDDSMLCAGSLKERQLICSENFGGLIQIHNYNYSCMHTLIGVTSFGNSHSALSPVIYTKISKYVPWIEKIVWPKTNL